MPILHVKTVGFRDLSLVTQPGTGRRGTGTGVVDGTSRASAGAHCPTVLSVRGSGREGLRGP